MTSYRIEVSDDGGNTFTDLVRRTKSERKKYGHTRLETGSTRYYRASAINSRGTGPASNVAHATTADAETPRAPTRLVSRASGSTQINLGWQPPEMDGGADIEGYWIEVSSDDGRSFSDLVVDTGTPDTSYSHTGLLAEQTRHYRVAAINAATTSSVANVAHATTEPDSAPAGGQGLVSNLHNQTRTHRRMIWFDHAQ